ncbi:hypothetical protein SH668x_001666 [Planctomicrobium sp. SH668]|uniref:hypothetical protein n=1 Tax=Planctomicrobium sp. SH668 TaxID=3448126 RepID=UPI003F5C59D6
MSRRYLSLMLLGCVWSLIALNGCSGDPGVTVSKVTGVLLVDDKPIKGATVVFNPVDPAIGRTASGKTVEDGSFELLTSGATRNGAMPGDYIVTFQKNIEVDKSGKEIVYEVKEYRPDSPPQVRGRTVSQIPERYVDVKTTDQKASVTTKVNHFDFNLKSK